LPQWVLILLLVKLFPAYSEKQLLFENNESAQ